jgi:hypothetical protein
MSLQFINDSQGNRNGVFIPIAEWERLKKKYDGLIDEEKVISALPEWQRQLLDARLSEHLSDPGQAQDFMQLLDAVSSGK